MTTKEFLIPEIFIDYLVNGKTEGLTEEQLTAVQKFEQENRIFETFPETDIPHWSNKCELTNGWDWVLAIDCICLCN